MKTGKKLAGILLALCLILSLLPMAALAAPAAPEGIWTEYAADAFAGGSGTEEDPYQIATPEQLAKLAADVNTGKEERKHTDEFFILNDNIDLSAHRWIPIGSGSEAEHCQGNGAESATFHLCEVNLDGNGKTITGLYVDESTEKYSAGLFGHYAGRYIKNLTITDAYVTTKAAANALGAPEGVGILSGCLGTKESRVENCHISGFVGGEKEDDHASIAIGGVVGREAFGRFCNCTANVTITNCSGEVGGFVGSGQMGSYIDCKAEGKIASDNPWTSVGGFAGNLESGSKLKRCASDVEIKAYSATVGGFVGVVDSAGVGVSDAIEIKNCVAFGDVICMITKPFNIDMGGFVGSMGKNTTIQNSHAAGAITNNSLFGGFIAVDNQGKTMSCSFDAEKNAGMKAVGRIAAAGTNEIEAGTTQKVLANICEDYYDGHDWDEESRTVKTEATCTKTGIQTQLCKRCGTMGESRIDLKPHELTKVAGKPATCTEDGYEAYWRCKVCEGIFADENGKEKLEEPVVIEAEGHKLEKTEGKPATCTEDGYEAYWTCKVCKKLFADEQAAKEIEKPAELKAKGHSFGAWKVTKAATATEKGEKERVCSVCQFTEKEEIPATGEKPNGPKTGDESKVNKWIVVPIVCVVVIAGLVVLLICISKKNKKNEK